jgi:hypothetical protein
VCLRLGGGQGLVGGGGSGLLKVARGSSGQVTSRGNSGFEAAIKRLQQLVAVAAFGRGHYCL